MEHFFPPVRRNLAELHGALGKEVEADCRFSLGEERLPLGKAPFGGDGRHLGQAFVIESRKEKRFSQYFLVIHGHSSQIECQIGVRAG